MITTRNVDTDKLNDYIAKSGLKISYISEQLGISRQAFERKRKNINAFRASEVFVLCTLLHISNEDKNDIFIL